MTKLIEGRCFNVNIFRDSSGNKILSLQLRTTEGKIWKFNMGKAFTDGPIKDYDDLCKLMMAKPMTISTANNSKRMITYAIEIM